MIDKADRIAYFKGTPREIGFATGRHIGKRLEENIDYYIRNRLLFPGALDRVRIQSEAIPRLRTLPVRFQEEIEGLAEGAGLPLQRVAESYAVEDSGQDGCSGFVSIIDGHAWVGRNVDYCGPEVWGFVAIKHVKDRIPTINFGMEADAFTMTGINREQLWLHYQGLPVPDIPRHDRPHFPAYVVLTEALETCATIGEVEKLLDTMDRDEGMILFAVDGKNDEAVLFECSCRQYIRRNPVEGRLVGANHSSNTEPSQITERSARRVNRLSELVGRNGWEGVHTPDDLIAALADDRIEERGELYLTVEAEVACPGQKKLWSTLGGYPAASRGNWAPIDWPW